MNFKILGMKARLFKMRTRVGFSFLTVINLQVVIIPKLCFVLECNFSSLNYGYVPCQRLKKQNWFPFSDVQR